VDAYGNLYALLLPPLMPRLGLNLLAVGTLAMCFQMATSVSQLAFGTLADRWRPHVLLLAGPILPVIVLSAIGAASSPLTLGAILVSAQWTSGWMFVALISVGGFLLQSTLPVNVTFGQQIAPLRGEDERVESRAGVRSRSRGSGSGWSSSSDARVPEPHRVI
jgi:MFS family permease